MSFTPSHLTTTNSKNQIINNNNNSNKKSYYVYYLGCEEAHGLRGEPVCLEILDRLLRKPQVAPSTVTLQVNDKGLKILQQIQDNHINKSTSSSASAHTLSHLANEQHFLLKHSSLSSTTCLVSNSPSGSGSCCGSGSVGYCSGSGSNSGSGLCLPDSSSSTTTNTNRQIKHFIPFDAVSYVCQQDDIVCCIVTAVLLYEPSSISTKCPLRCHAYRCDSHLTASALTDHLNVYVLREEQQKKLDLIESKLILHQHHQQQQQLVRKQITGGGHYSPLQHRHNMIKNSHNKNKIPIHVHMPQVMRIPAANTGAPPIMGVMPKSNQKMQLAGGGAAGRTKSQVSCILPGASAQHPSVMAPVAMGPLNGEARSGGAHHHDNQLVVIVNDDPLNGIAEPIIGRRLPSKSIQPYPMGQASLPNDDSIIHYHGSIMKSSNSHNNRDGTDMLIVPHHQSQSHHHHSQSHNQLAQQVKQVQQAPMVVGRRSYRPQATSNAPPPASYSTGGDLEHALHDAHYRTSAPSINYHHMHQQQHPASALSCNNTIKQAIHYKFVDDSHHCSHLNQSPRLDQHKRPHTQYNDQDHYHYHHHRHHHHQLISKVSSHDHHDDQHRQMIKAPSPIHHQARHQHRRQHDINDLSLKGDKSIELNRHADDGTRLSSEGQIRSSRLEPSNIAVGRYISSGKSGCNDLCSLSSSSSCSSLCSLSNSECDANSLDSRSRSPCSQCSCCSSASRSQIQPTPKSRSIRRARSGSLSRPTATSATMKTTTGHHKLRHRSISSHRHEYHHQHQQVARDDSSSVNHQRNQLANVHYPPQHLLISSSASLPFEGCATALPASSQLDTCDSSNCAHQMRHHRHNHNTSRHHLSHLHTQANSRHNHNHHHNNHNHNHHNNNNNNNHNGQTRALSPNSLHKQTTGEVPRTSNIHSASEQSISLHHQQQHHHHHRHRHRRHHHRHQRAPDPSGTKRGDADKSALVNNQQQVSHLMAHQKRRSSLDRQAPHLTQRNALMSASVSSSSSSPTDNAAMTRTTTGESFGSQSRRGLGRGVPPACAIKATKATNAINVTASSSSSVTKRSSSLSSSSSSSAQNNHAILNKCKTKLSSIGINGLRHGHCHEQQVDAEEEEGHGDGDGDEDEEKDDDQLKPMIGFMYESLAAELKAKLGNPEVGPLLLPPKDYDTMSRKQGKLTGIELRRSTNSQIVGPKTTTSAIIGSSNQDHPVADRHHSTTGAGPTSADSSIAGSSNGCEGSVSARSNSSSGLGSSSIGGASSSSGEDLSQQDHDEVGKKSSPMIKSRSPQIHKQSATNNKLATLGDDGGDDSNKWPNVPKKPPRVSVEVANHTDDTTNPCNNTIAAAILPKKQHHDRRGESSPPLEKVSTGSDSMRGEEEIFLRDTSKVYYYSNTTKAAPATPPISTTSAPRVTSTNKSAGEATRPTDNNNNSNSDNGAKQQMTNKESLFAIRESILKQSDDTLNEANHQQVNASSSNLGRLWHGRVEVPLKINNKSDTTYLATKRIIY